MNTQAEVGVVEADVVVKLLIAVLIVDVVVVVVVAAVFKVLVIAIASVYWSITTCIYKEYKTI